MSSIVNTINSNLPPTSSTPTGSASGSQTLTQQDFLKIMVAQFTQQDPLSSGDGSGSDSGTSDYVNQLMSMTNLTTMQTMSGQIADQLATNLPGATVQVTDANGNVVSGVVQKTGIGSQGVTLTINGTQYLSSNLVEVDQTAAQAAAAAAAQQAANGTTTPATGTNN